jgi:mRNA interferase RelE/StbE
VPAGRYALRYNRTAVRTLESEKIPISVIDAALAFIETELVTNPRLVGKRLLPPLDGQWVARRGSYRITYEILDRLISMIDITHRSDTYRNP